MATSPLPLHTILGLFAVALFLTSFLLLRRCNKWNYRSKKHSSNAKQSMKRRRENPLGQFSWPEDFTYLDGIEVQGKKIRAFQLKRSYIQVLRLDSSHPAYNGGKGLGGFALKLIQKGPPTHPSAFCDSSHRNTCICLTQGSTDVSFSIAHLLSW